ncbi:cytidine deaminase [Pseudobutyrivibrio sp. UC1225]|uniref:cytidine deaminase n=1 Tax=Pseudobutyrivibrio sp. UC1225 TaxID=1798185 RepID=UPI000B871826|nr:cytidine deaminase [Pseudobutyrivibrio sp. UC1225]
MTDFQLIKLALEAREMAYTPYSHHKVGAALLCSDGTVFKGCNIENAGYTPTNCAERTAVFKAVSEGKKDFEAIAIVGGMDNLKSLPLCAPCGVCRQVLREFVAPEKFKVLLAEVEDVSNVSTIEETSVKITTMTLSELLPLGFGPENLVL